MAATGDVDASGNDAIIAGVATILQQASAALARLGSDATNQQCGDFPGVQGSQSPGQSIAGAAAALAQVAVQFGGGAAVGAGVAGNDGGCSRGPIGPRRSPRGAAGYEDRRVAEDAEPLMSTQEFCDVHHLEPWVGETLELLLPAQRAAVMNPQMNIGRARNLNGIVVSRIKQAVPLDQRLGTFVQINGLADAVVDRISTLTQEQAEALLDSGFKIQKADNPSGVAMKRITDVIRGTICERPGRGRDKHSDGWTDGGRSRSDRSRTPAGLHFRSGSADGSGSDTPEDVQSFMDLLGLEWWCGEVLKRLSLWQRQQTIKELQNLQNVRNPSGVVMSRVKTVVDTSELMSIFIDINQFDRSMQEQLLSLAPDQQQAVINPGIYLQNVRNPNTAVRSRINNVLAGRDAFGKQITA